MYLEAALLGLIIGWLRGGSFKKLGQAELRYWLLALLGFALQAVIWADFQLGRHFLSAWIPGLHIISYLPLLLFVYENLEKPGMALLGTGTFLNFSAIAFNGGRMPVSVYAVPEQFRQQLISGSNSPLHAAMTNETLLPFLGDLIGIPLIWNKVVSAGDLLISLGLLLLAHGLIKAKKEAPYRHSHSIR